MRHSAAIEIGVGFFVVIGIIALFFMAMQVSNVSQWFTTQGSYHITARFENIGGLKVRAPVSMAGVTIGRVDRIDFDTKTYQAVVSMRIEDAYRTLPIDTSASILTAGLLGEQYIGLSAGGEDVTLKEGDEIDITQSAMVLEQLISHFLFNKVESNSSDKKDEKPSPE